MARRTRLIAHRTRLDGDALPLEHLLSPSRGFNMTDGAKRATRRAVGDAHGRGDAGRGGVPAGRGAGGGSEETSTAWRGFSTRKGLYRTDGAKRPTYRENTLRGVNSASGRLCLAPRPRPCRLQELLQPVRLGAHFRRPCCQVAAPLIPQPRLEPPRGEVLTRHGTVRSAQSQKVGDVVGLIG